MSANSPGLLVAAWQQIRDEPVGIVDGLGYVYCTECATVLGKTGVSVRSLPHAGEPCDLCGRVLDAAR